MPTTYVVCDHLPSGHSPFLSMPDELATVISRESEEFMRVGTDQEA
ncbi:hypothetical protein [Streptomyces cyaneus]|nr:hypothetical protein [Streptomyces cyaneus]